MGKMKWFKTVFLRPFALGIVAVSFLGVLTTGIVTSRVVRNVINESVIGITQREKVIQAREIDAWFSNAVQTINNLAGLLPMMPANWFEPVIVHFTETYDFIDNVFIGFPDGDTINGRGWVPEEGWSLFDRPWYIAALEAEPWEVVILDAFWSYSGQTYASAMSMRIPEVRLDDLGDVGIVLGFSISLDEIIERVNEIHDQVSDGSYFMLIGGSGQMIAHTNVDVYDMRDFTQTPSGILIAQSIEHGSDITQFTDDTVGSAYLITVPVESLGWTLAAVIPSSSLDAIVMDHLDVVWLAFTAFVVVSILAVVAVNIRFSKDTAKQKMQLVARERQIYNANPIPSTIWSSEKELLECNNAMIQFFGLSNQAEVKKHFYEYSPEYQPCGTSSADHLAKAQEEVITKGIARFKWLHVMPEDGERIPAEIIMVRIDIENDDYLLAAYMHDLRESEAAMEMERQSKLAEQESRAKSRFLAQVSHEIRTPLNSIIGVAEIQLQNAAVDTEMEDALLRIHNSSHMLLSLINNLLDLSKVEADKMEINDRHYELMSLIYDVMQMNTIYIGSKQIDFDLCVDPQLPAQLIGDSLRVKQICNNILSNAFKYTDEGEVTLIFNCEADPHSDRMILVVSVYDTGRGMTKEQLRVLFSEEYIRFDEEESTEVQGTGLGMTITYKLIRMMDGDIRVESEPGKGTYVTVRIPQQRACNLVIGEKAAENLQSFKITSMASRKRRLRDVEYEPMPYGRVLVVDDSETNLYVAKGLLSPYGLEIDTAISGVETIDKVKRGESYDIIFMDHMMPEMDGMETVQHLRKMGYDLPIVALTANALVGQSELFMQSGFQGFISKPIDMRHLNTYLERLIRDKKPPEVVKAARRAARQSVHAEKQESATIDEGADARKFDELNAPFLRDANRAASVLESFVARMAFDADSLKEYTTQVHSMKSALKNIGESALSDVAFRLEEAGRNGDTELIKDQTQSFLESLVSIIDKLSPKAVSSEESDDPGDLEFLHEQLNIIKTSCETYDMSAANGAISAIRQNPYPQKIQSAVDEISVFLLHGDFDEAIEMVQNMLEQ